MSPQHHDFSDIVDAAQKSANELATSGAWTPTDNERLNVLFEQATIAALKVPAFTERSRVLRGLVVRFVPKALRPGLKKCARLADRTLRAAYKVARKQ